MGYAGCGRLIAFEVSTTEGTRCVVGGFTTGGSGALSGTTTVACVLGHPTQVPESVVEADGGSTFRSPIRKWPVTGGMGDDLVPTLSGTFVGSSVRAMASVRIGTSTFRSTA